MSAQDINAQGTKIRISTTEAAGINITGISKANPCVVTAANTFAAGDIVYISGIVGMTELNGRAFVVATPAAGNFQLKGIDSTNFGTWTSGGTVKKQTMTDIGSIKGFDGFDGQASEIDVTDLDSVAKEYLIGLQDFGNVSLDIGLLASDAGQDAMKAAKASGLAKVFTITTKAGPVAAFVAYVKSFTTSGSPDSSLKGKASLRITGAPSFFV